MTRKEIIEKLKEYNLDIKRYIIISGTAMVIYGIKEETPDIDISVTEDLETELLEEYPAILEHFSQNSHHAYLINGELNFGRNYYSDNKNIVDGLPLQTIEDIISLKEKLNRQKDKSDIELIKKYLKK